MRIDCQRTCQRRALTHAARQLMWIMAREFRKFEIGKERLRAALAFLRREALNFNAEHDVLGDGAPRQKQVLLKHKRDVGVGAGDALAVARPEPILRSVLLPQPVGPMSDTTSASQTAKLTPRTAVSAPSPLASAKRIVTL